MIGIEVEVEGLTLVGRQLEVGLVGVNHDLDGIVGEEANDEEASDEAAVVDDDVASSSLHDAVVVVVEGVAEHVVDVVDVEDAEDAAEVAAEDVGDSDGVEDAFAFASAFVDAFAYDLDVLASSFEHSDVVAVAAFVDVEEPFVEDAVEEAFLASDQQDSSLFSTFAVFELTWPVTLFCSQQPL